MLSPGIIRKSNSPFASPIVIVKKKNGSNRICVDYRKLNKLTGADPEPMTTAEDLFQRLGKSKYNSKIDLSKGYWQIPVAEKDIKKTAFVTPDGTYDFLRMPFAMKNSGATLVRGMRKILAGMSSVDSYIDNLIIHAKIDKRIYKCWKNCFDVCGKQDLQQSDENVYSGPNPLNFLDIIWAVTGLQLMKTI